MNKYQKAILCANNLISISTIDYNNKVEHFKDFDFENDSITVTQNENYNITKYVLTLPIKGIERISLLKSNDEWENIEYDAKHKVVKINLDFEDKIKKIKFKFVDNIADELEMKVIFKDADKKLYDAKIKAEFEAKEREKLLKALSLSHACGQDLVNIKFQNCNNEVAYTKISLYDYNGESRERQLMATYKVEEGVFFKAIKDLAYGRYEYKVEQFDKNDNLIVSSEYIEFKIIPPGYGYFGKNQVCN